MKALIISLLAAGAMAAATSSLAATADWQNMDGRRANLDQRIDTGVRNGSLNGAEAAELRGEFSQITNLELTYRNTGGGLSADERSDLDRRMDLLGRNIQYYSVSAQPPRWQSINARQAALEMRIKQGVTSGALTHAQAVRLRTDFRGIVRLEATYRRSGGAFTASERTDLDRRMDALSARVSVAKHDGHTRG